jgi:hypothetical protein
VLVQKLPVSVHSTMEGAPGLGLRGSNAQRSAHNGQDNSSSASASCISSARQQASQ